ncbi:MAG: AAA family ATPase, partial [Gemmataceae bacterium]
HLKLKQIGDRLKLNHKAKFEYAPEVVETVAARCKDVDSGARNADHILTGTLLPKMSEEVLARMAEGRPVKKVTISVDAQSRFVYAVE